MNETADATSRWQRGLRWFLAIAYGLAGIIHIARPDWFMAIMPAVMPWPRAVILVTGACEIAGAAALLGHSLRRAAGVALALYAVCVYPANIKHAIDDLALAEPVLGWAYHGPRLAFQPVLVWAALFAADVIRWPFGRR